MIACLAGCSNLDEVAAEGCGNLVLNADEDCDGFSQFGEGTACGVPEDDNACHYVCDADEGIVCPDGWGCGSDGRCRAPSGAFTQADGAPFTFPVSQLAIGDVDGDGQSDLIGNDLSTIRLRFGIAGGGFEGDLDVLTRTPTGLLAFGNFDDDARLDAVVPIDSGLFTLLGTEDRELDPFPYAPFEVQQGGSLRILPVESFADFDTELVGFVDDEMAFLESIGAVEDLPAGHGTSQIAGAIARGKLGEDLDTAMSEDGRTEWALAFTDEDQIWVYTSTGTESGLGSNLSPELYQTVALPGTVRYGAAFGDVNGDGWLDLLVSVENDMGDSAVAVSLNNGLGTLQAVARPAPEFTRASAIEPWPLAVGDLDGDGVADYVFADRISITTQLGLDGLPAEIKGVASVTSQPWVGAELTDINGDGRVDVATHIEGVDGIDFFVNTGFVLFNKFHVDTDDPPDILRTGDFDGDLILDIAFKENVVAQGGQEPNRVSVVFGSPFSSPSEPISMGTLDVILDLQPMLAFGGPESIDLITDLFAVSASLDGDTTAVAILQGSSSRRMISPFTLDPDEAEGEPDVRDIPSAVVVAEATGDEFADIVAIAQPAADVFNEDGSTPGGTGPFQDVSRLWVLPGEDGTGDIDAGATQYVEMPASDAFDADDAMYTAVDLDGDGRDEIIGIDRTFEEWGGPFSPQSRMLIARMSGGTAAFQTYTLPEDYRVISDLRAADLDGNGKSDVFAVFSGEYRGGSAGDGGESVPGAAVVVFWNLDGELPVDSASILEVPASSLFGVAPIRLDGDAVPELAVLGQGGVFTAAIDLETKQYGEAVRVFQSMGDGKIAVGDLDGDGLDDVAYTVGNDVQIALQLPAEPLGAAAATDQGGTP